MFLKKILRFFRGTILFYTQNGVPERLINKLRDENIQIWNLSLYDDGIKAFCLAKDYKKLCLFAKSLNVDIVEQEKKGLVFILLRYKLRFGVLVGFLFFISFLILSQFFIWDIKVEGNEFIDKSVIINTLEESGIHSLSFYPSIDFKQKKHEVLLKTPLLSWIGFTKSGSTLLVQVTEKREVPELVDESPCDLIAKADGVIRYIEVHSGVKKVKLNHTVKKGDVLVSGTFVAKNGVVGKTKADGKIIAECNIDKNFTLDKNAMERSYTGEIKTRMFFNFFALRIPLFFATPIEGNYEISYDRCNMNLFGTEIPVGIESFHYTFYNKAEATLTDEHIAALLDNQVKQFEATELADCAIIKRECIDSEENGVVNRKISYYIEQDIAAKVLIDPTVPKEPIPPDQINWEDYNN